MFGGSLLNSFFQDDPFFSDPFFNNSGIMSMNNMMNDFFPHNQYNNNYYSNQQMRNNNRNNPGVRIEEVGSDEEYTADDLYHNQHLNDNSYNSYRNPIFHNQPRIEEPIDGDITGENRRRNRNSGIHGDERLDNFHNRQNRSRSNGFNNDLFSMMNSMLDNMHMGPMMHNNSGGSSYSSFSSTSYSSSNGSQPIVRTQTSTTSSVNGVTQTQSSYSDSASGTERIAIKRGIGNKTREIVKERNAEGKEMTFDNCNNIEEEELNEFDQKWDQAAKQVHLDSLTSATIHNSFQPRLIGASTDTNSTRLALPAASSSSTNNSQNTQRSTSNSTTNRFITPSNIASNSSRPTTRHPSSSTTTSSTRFQSNSSSSTKPNLSNRTTSTSSSRRH